MSSSLRIIAREENGTILVKVIIPHPSESGLRKDEQGNTVPAHFIMEGSVTLNGVPVVALELGPAVSKDPFLQFRFKGKKGDTVNVIFLDNHNEQFTAETVVQ